MPVTNKVKKPKKGDQLSARGFGDVIDLCKQFQGLKNGIVVGGMVLTRPGLGGPGGTSAQIEGAWALLDAATGAPAFPPLTDNSDLILDDGDPPSVTIGQCTEVTLMRFKTLNGKIIRPFQFEAETDIVGGEAVPRRAHLLNPSLTLLTKAQDNPILLSGWAATTGGYVDESGDPYLDDIKWVFCPCWPDPRGFPGYELGSVAGDSQGLHHKGGSPGFRVLGRLCTS